MNKKGISKGRQRRLTLVGISSVLVVWLAALALLFAQPGAQSSGDVLPTLASPLQEVVTLPDTGAAVDTISPTIPPTTLPVEPPPGFERQPETSLVSALSNPVPSSSENLFTNPTILDIPSEPVPDSLVIRFKPEMSEQERLDYIASLGGQIVQEIKPLNTVIISVPEGGASSIQSAAPAGIESEPDYYAGALFAPNDSLAAGQWGLTTVRAPEAWDLLPVPTPGVTVAVVDSGICAAHPDLQGRITSDGWDFVQNDATPQDEFGHGCAVSGIIAANSNNGLGIAGVAPNANVMPLRVLDATGIGRYSNVAAAIVYAVDNGAQAINLSLGGPNPSTVLQEAVNYAEARGVRVIAAAGNGASEQVYYPAAYPSVVAVGSVDQNLQRSSFSNFGPDVDLYAPGSNIMTTRLDGSFQTASGTSVAAPYVTGVWALREGMGKALVVNGGIVSAIYEDEIPVPTEEPPSELCLLSNLQGAERAYFDLVWQNAAQPGSVSSEQLAAARDLYLTLGGQCANVLYDDTMTIDGGGISPFGGDIEPLFQVFGTKWGAQSPFNVGQPPATPAGTITYSFMPNNVSLAAKEAENGGGPNAFITTIGDLPGNSATCNLQDRVRQAFAAWSTVANIQLTEVQEAGLVPFGDTGQIGDIRIGAQYIDGMRGELGHAYFPPPDPEIAVSTRAGDVFLDRSEIWGCAPGEMIMPDGSSARVIDIGLVVLHELGHSLGMQHERAPGLLALMNPTYNTNLITDDAGGTLPLANALRNDDQAGARAIYGALGIGVPALTPLINTDDNTPTFNWTDTTVGGSVSFQIQIYVDNSGQPGDLVFDGTTTGGSPTSPNKSFTIPNALASQPYLWRMRAFDIDANGVGAWGDWSPYQSFSITVGIASLREPTPGQVLNSGLVRFQWSPVTGDNTFLLQIDTRPEFTAPQEFPGIGGTTFTLLTPLEDGTYYWRVQAAGSTQFSQVGSFRVDANVQIVNLGPGAPNAAPADGQVFTTNANITLQWDALPGVTEYQLQLDTSENFIGLLFLDKLFLDKLFLDKLFLDKLFLDKLFLDKLFLDKLFLDKLFLDKLFLDKLFLDKLFLDKLFLDKLFLDKLFLDKLFLDKLFLDKLFLDKLFLDKIQAEAGNPVITQVFDSLPMSEGVHYWRVRPRLADGSFGPWSAMRSFEVRTQPVKVVINEIKLNDPSWIEFRNTGTQAADMSGWQFFAYGPDGETDLLYTFPSGFTLQAGAYVVLYEGQGTDSDKALYTGGSQIEWPLVAQSVEGQTVNEPGALAGLGTVLPPAVPANESGVDAATIVQAGVESDSTPVPSGSVRPSANLPQETEDTTAAGQGVEEDEVVTAQAVITVNTTNVAVADDGQCSLVEAITAANTNTASGAAAGECAAGSGFETDTIVLPSTEPYILTGVNNDTDGENGLPSITSDITIDGVSPDTTAITRDDGAPQFRIFHVATEGILTLNNITLSSGRSVRGGAVFNAGTLTFNNVRALDNRASDTGGAVYNIGIFNSATGVYFNNRANSQGGAIDNNGDLMVASTTFDSNHVSEGQGGAIMTEGPAGIYNSTFSGNTALSGSAISAPNLNGKTISFSTIVNNSGGGAAVVGLQSLEIRHSIIANNPNGDCSLMIGSTTINASGNNFDSDGSCAALDSDFTTVTSGELNLGSLTDNGGPSPTHMLGAGSVAIDAASDCLDVNGATVNFDQRFINRPQRANCDVGGYEVVELIGTTFTVNATTDTDDGTCDAIHCTLREAINAANALSGMDTIAFTIPGVGPHTIQPTSALPTITDPVLISGETEPDFVGTPIIELDGSLAGDVNGLTITAGNSQVRGLVINRFGTLEFGYGIVLQTGGGNTIQNNYIGTDVTGTLDRGNNLAGIWVADSANNLIGGSTDGSIPVYNVISGNGSVAAPDRHGILISGVNSSGNVVAGNFIGTDVTGSQPLGNSRSGVAILFDASDNLIGQNNVMGLGNIISANTESGVFIQAGANNNTVAGNIIGSDSNALVDLGNGLDGVSIDGSSGNLIGGTTPPTLNVITGNAGSGVAIYGASSDGNSILGNSINANDGLGIDLVPDGFTSDGVTANDALDADTGANRLQNFPVITEATTSGSSIRIVGTINSTPNENFTIQFLSSPACDASGNGEGKVSLGQVNPIITNDSGKGNFDVTLPVAVAVGEFITTTATDSLGNTSEFSACYAATSGSDTPQSGPTFTVNTTTTTDDGVCGTANCTLIEAVNAANAQAGANTINFSITLPATVTLNATLPTVSSEITINGPGSLQFAISGNDLVRPFFVGLDGVLTLSNLAVQNGLATTLDGGGGLYNAGGTVILSDVLFRDNATSASQYGGAVFNQAGTLTVNNSTFQNNSADYGGGAIFNWKGSTTITNSNFNGNSAKTGGALHNYSPDGVTASMTVNGGDLNNNAAGSEPGQGGGAMMSEGSVGAAALVINGANIQNNSGYQGGALWVNSGTATLNNTTISNNTVPGQGGGLASSGTVTITNTNFTDNTADMGGGIINNGTLTITGSVFNGNQTTLNQGGAVANFATVTVDQSMFTNNIAALNGGAIDNAAYGTTASVTITNSTFNNNTAAGVGGALLNFADTGATGLISIRNSTISSNTSTIGLGGGIANFGGGGTETLTVEFTTLARNEATSGANLFNAPDKTGNVKNSITALPVSGANCAGFITSGGGNFMDDISCNGFIQVTAGQLNLGLLANNGGPTATILPGTASVAINGAADCLAFNDTTITADQRGIARPQGAQCDSGAVEVVPAGNLTVTTTDMIQDGADGKCSLVEAIVAANTDTASGGAAGECVPASTLPNTPDVITLGTNQTYPLTEVNNETNGPNGLPVVSSNITLVMNGSTIRRAADAPTEFRIFALSSTGILNIDGGIISGGRLSASRDGAAFLNLGVLNVTNVTISDNQTGGNGGAIFSNPPSANLTIIDSRLLNNKGANGGAIYNAGVGITLMNTILRDNEATSGSGGAVYTNGIAVLNGGGSSYINNKAAQNGGAIYNNGGNIQVFNPTISGNQANAGGALYLAGGAQLIVAHATIADNITLDNGNAAIQNGSTPLELSNSIVANNTGGASCSGSITDMGGNLQFPDESCLAYFYTANPLLGALTNAGNAYFYPLLNGSPAIDNGSPGFCASVDIRGVARPIGAGCDSGSYEGSIAQTGDLTVTTTAEVVNPLDGLCSLVEAIDAANSGNLSGSAPGECVPVGGPDADVITLGNSLTYTLTTVNNTTNGENGLPVIVSPITINANGSTITRFNGAAFFRFIYIAPVGSLTLNNATLSNGFSGVGGGAILAEGDLTLNNSTIADNAASSGGGLFLNGSSAITASAITGNDALSNDGGGIFVGGTLTVTNSTIAGNSAAQFGGGLVTSADDFYTPDVTILNSTIAGNVATPSFGTGAGIAVFYGSVGLTNSIIADNLSTIGNASSNCGVLGSGFIANDGGNLQSDFTCFGDTQPAQDPLLGPLTGSPAYLPLGTGSPAIDAANAAFCPAADQRGVSRPQGAGCDIGAVEASEAPALVPGSTGGAASLVQNGVIQDFVRFGDTTLSPLMESEWRGDNVPLPDDPTDTNMTIGRDPASGDANHVTDWLRQRPTEGGQNAIRVLINEIYTGTNDLVELFNPAAETANLSGWELILYDADDQIIPATPGATYTLRFPNGTLLRPGQFLIVAEENPGGTNFIDIGVAVNWDDWNASGAISLTNGLTGVDFVRFGGSTINQLAVNPPPGTSFTGIVQPPLPGESLGRNGNSEDTNTPSDWLSQTRSAGQNNPVVEPPAHDEFPGAITIDSLPFRDTGDTMNASAVSDPALSCGVSVGHTVWYKFVATDSSPVRFQTDGSAFDTVLAIFRLNASNQLVPVSGQCSQRGNAPIGSRLTLTPTAGTTYLILLGGNLNTSGPYIFSVNAPANDDVDAATSINLGALPFRTFGLDGQGERVTNSSTPNTTAASSLVTDPAPTCAPNVGRSVWYRFTAADDTTLRLRTAGTAFDTVIAIYMGTRDNLVEAACNNDDAGDTTSDLGFMPVPGTEYFVQVSGNGDQGGDLFFEVDVFPTPDNDLITDAFAIIPDNDPTLFGKFRVIVGADQIPAPFAQDTTGAGNLLVSDDNDPLTDPILDPVALPEDICGMSLGGSVWFAYTPSTDDTVVFQTFNSNYDTALAIWSVPVSDPPVDLSDPANLRFEACNDDAGVIEDDTIDPSDPFQRVNKNARVILSNTAEDADMPIELGRTYYIRVSGYFGQTGDLIFNVFTPQTAPPANDRIDTPFDIEFNAADGSYTVISPAGSDVVPFAQDTTGAFPELRISNPAPSGWQPEADFPTPSCGTDVGYTVWYRYAASERQQVIFDAAGSDFDTVIAAYVLQGENNWVEVGCNDDFEGRPQSKLSLNTSDGVTLYVLFGGFKQDRGNLQLGIAEVLPVVDTFTLVDADLGTDIPNFNPLVDAAELDLSQLPPSLAIRANTIPEEIGSVMFKLERDEGGALTIVLETTDNTMPYALSGNNPDGSYIPTTLLPGAYTLTATPYTDVDSNAGQGRAGTPLTITFTVVEGVNAAPTITVDQGGVTVAEGLPITNTGTFADPDGDSTLVQLTASIGIVVPAPDNTWSWSYTPPDGPLEQVVTITATDSGGKTANVAFDLTVTNVNPAAQFSPAFVSQNVRRLTFANPVDVAADLPGLRYSYDCSFDNDGDSSNDNFDVENVTETFYDCTFAAFGTYQVRGRVADKDGGFTDYNATVVIQPDNTAPVVNAGADQLITLPANSVNLSGTASDDGLPTPPTLAVTWSAVNNPPAPVTFGDASALNTTATFTVSGVYTLQLAVSDGELTGADTLTVVVNLAPVVNAGVDQTITLPTSSVNLNGTASDDGLPPGSVLTVTWSAINNPPAPVTFGDANALSTTATFSAAGTYTLQLSASDGASVSTDTLTVTVNAPQNQAPMVNAGADQLITLPTNSVNLSGTATDDGLPTPPTLTVTWSAINNPPAPVIFSAPNALNTTATFSAGGVYTLQLAASDGELTTTDTLTVIVNQAPVVNAGADQTITLPVNSVNLNGSAIDDGLPTPPTLTVTWSAINNPPAPVTFGNANALATTATFSAAGTYTLQLTASDGVSIGTDTLIVTVQPPANQTTTISESVEASSDDVNEDGSSFDARNRQLWVGTGQSVSKSFLGLRFNDLDIPQGAVITEAHVEFYTPTSQWIRMRVLVGADAVDNSVTFSANNRPSGRTFTTARIEHRSDTPWMAGKWNSLGDIKTVIQEIVNRPGWQPGNSLSILMKGLGAQWGRKFVTSYDGDPAFAPRLVVTYAGGAPTNNPPDVNVDPAYANVVVNEGQPAIATGTVSDPENNVVTLSASLGTVQKNGNTWSWSYTPPDNLPAPQTVTITAKDSQNATDTAAFSLTVNNVNPTATFTAQPTSTIPNTPVMLTFSNPVDVAADLPGLLYSFDCGNGVSSPPGTTTQFSCTYASEGSFTALGIVIDKDGGSTTYQAAITITSAPAEPTTITSQVNSASDDVTEVDTTIELNNPNIWVGTYGSSGQSYTGLRFNNLNIPVGATITEARLEFYTSSAQWIQIDVLIAAEAADNSQTFSNSSRPSGRAFTTNRIEHHSNESWPGNTWNTLTGNLSSVMQEVVSRAGWQPGNSLSVILKGIGTPFGRKFVTSYDGNPAFAPRLVVRYTVPTLPAPETEEPPPSGLILPIPPGAAFTSDMTSGVAPAAVQFTNLSTGDITGYTWDFGDGNTSPDLNPAHTYSAAGTYTVMLTVTGVDGSTSLAQSVIVVTEPPPPPPPTEEVTAPPPEEVQQDDSVGQPTSSP